MQPVPLLDLNLRGIRVHIVDELTPAAEGTQCSVAGPPSAHGLQHWPGPPRSLGGEDSPVLAPNLPQGEGEHDDNSGPLFGCNIPMQEHKHPPPHPPQLPPLAAAHLGAAESSYLHSFSVSLDGSVHM